MGTSFEDILNRMRNAPHNGIPPVTNPNVPSKVERDVAAFEARQREMPKFHFGTGSQLDNILARMHDSPHVTPTYHDTSFTQPTQILDTIRADYADYMSELQKVYGDK